MFVYSYLKESYLKKGDHPSSWIPFRGHVICADGFHFSIQGGAEHFYCTPRARINEYTSVEVGGLPEDFDNPFEFHITDSNASDTPVIPFVDILHLEKFVDSHGGVASNFKHPFNNTRWDFDMNDTLEKLNFVAGWLRDYIPELIGDSEFELFTIGDDISGLLPGIQNYTTKILAMNEINLPKISINIQYKEEYISTVIPLSKYCDEKALEGSILILKSFQSAIDSS